MDLLQKMVYYFLEYFLEASALLITGFVILSELSKLF